MNIEICSKCENTRDSYFREMFLEEMMSGASSKDYVNHSMDNNLKVARLQVHRKMWRLWPCKWGKEGELTRLVILNLEVHHKCRFYVCVTERLMVPLKEKGIQRAFLFWHVVRNLIMWCLSLLCPFVCIKIDLIHRITSS